MEYETKMHTDMHKSTHSEMGPVWRNSIQRAKIRS